MLTLEFACRDFGSPDAKGAKLTDPFEVARCLLNPTKSLHIDYLGDVIRNFSILESLLWNNFLQGPPSRTSMSDLMQAYDAWLLLAEASKMFANPVGQEVLERR